MMDVPNAILTMIYEIKHVNPDIIGCKEYNADGCTKCDRWLWFMK